MMAECIPVLQQIKAKYSLPNYHQLIVKMIIIISLDMQEVF